jgi:hypothetical protein
LRQQQAAPKTLQHLEVEALALLNTSDQPTKVSPVSFF